MNATTVYRLFDAEGALLYIGVTGNVAERFANHEREKGWWPTVADRTFTEYPTRFEALQAERGAIDSENPLHNVQRKGRPAWPRMKQEHDDLVSLSVRVPRETADRLREIAEADYRPVAAEIRRLIQARVDEASKKRRAS